MSMKIPLRIKTSKDITKTCLESTINDVETEILNLANDPELRKGKSIDNCITLDFAWRHVVPEEWFVAAANSSAEIEVQIKPQLTQIVITPKARK